MKHIFTATLLFFTSVLAFGQTPERLIERADFFYENYSFNKAIPLYEDYIAKIDTNVQAYANLADAYRMINRVENASLWYARIIGLPTTEPIVNLHYAQVLQQLDKCDEAVTYFKEYLKWEENNRVALQGIKSCESQDEILNQAQLYQIASLPVNSEFSEIGPLEKDGKLYFASDRFGDRKRNKTYGWTGASFFDIYTTEKNAEGQLQDPQVLMEKANSIYHDGPAFISHDGMMMLFTRNQYNPRLIGARAKKGEDDKVRLKTMYSKYDTTSNTWSNPKDINLNNVDYSVTHPTLSKDNKYLYFASDMPGGIGGLDIWKAEWTAADTLGKPVNVISVNTAGDEIFPYLDASGDLYFTSNGHPGLGGFDVFRGRYNKDTKEFLRIWNLGSPVNTVRDDLSFTVSQDNALKGMFASNRISGMGGDDIYSAINEGVFTELTVKDKHTGQAIENAEVMITYDGSQVYMGESNQYGFVNAPLEAGKVYMINATHPEYKVYDNEIDLTEAKSGDIFQQEILMESNLGLQLKALVIESISQLPVEGATVEIESFGYSAEVRTYTTDNSGLVYQEIFPNTKYIARAMKDGYEMASVEFDTYGMNTVGEEKLVKLVLDGGEVLCNVAFNHVYFEFDKSRITSEASTDLEKMLDIMKISDRLRVEISAHTDSRGSDSYNMNLSDRRSSSVVNWLIENGIASDRMISKGYGETRLVNNCGNGVPCSADEHQANRRVEFAVIDVNNKVICESEEKSF